MDRRQFLAASLGGLALSGRARGQAVTRAVRIGWLTAQQASSLTPYLAAMRASLAELGYIEGRNLTIDYRYGDDSVERVPALASELVKLGVDLIVVQGAAAPVVSKLGLATPGVFVFSGDPVSAGLAESLARPRGNMTGVTLLAAELNGKRIEILRDVVPGLKRVTVLANPEHPGADLERSYSEGVAQRLGLAIQYVPTPTQDALTRAFEMMKADPPQAISLFADGFAVQNRAEIIAFATSQRAPVVSGWPVFAQSGALCTYGPRLVDSYRRLAAYVDKVLKGARPDSLPIEQPTTFETVVNMRAAKILGLAIPQSLLVGADQLIE